MKPTRILAAWILTLILISSIIVTGTITAESGDIEFEGVGSVEVDPVPADAIRLCEECENNDIQAAIDAAPDSAVVVVDGGIWPSIHINKPLRLVAENEPVIDAAGEGTGIKIDSDDVSVEGFDIRNTGRSFDKEDSGIYFEGQRTRIINNRLSQVHFGINGATGHDSVIAGNSIVGYNGISEGLRGDGIKVWYSHRVQIHHNHVTNSRDLLVWYSNECNVYENLVTDSRYGFHFMNSDDGFASANQLVDNSVGIYIMYGKRFTIENNLLQGSRGPSGHGIGLKEVDGFDVIDNVIYDNRIGVYNDNSPFSIGAVGNFHRNMIAFNDIGIGAMPSARSNVYYENSFVENLEQVTVLGGGELSELNVWNKDGIGNYWSDYTGYDSDGNGIGDIAYRNENFSEQLRQSHPQLQIFRFSLAETAVDFAAEAMPIFEAKSVLEDVSPLVNPVSPVNAPSVHQQDSTVRITSISFALLASVAGSIWWATRPTRAAAEIQEIA